MSMQYDSIGLSYESVKRLPGGILERNNIRTVISPFLANPATGTRARVLDLACGTGYYSRLLLSWGAAHVVGVDISSTMIEAARASLSPSEAESLTFLVGDCSQPLVIDSGPFDVVLGSWLLNYAPSGAEMTRMFLNISAQLKPGGHFVGLTPHPAADLDTFAALFDPASPSPLALHVRKYGVSVAYTAKTPDESGYATKITVHVAPQDIQFENFHLRRDVYEASARAGGMAGKLEWRGLKIPSADESASEYGVSPDFWEGYEVAPHLGMLVVEK